MELRKQLRNYPWVDVPCHHDVKKLLSKQKASHSYFKRGNGDATEALDEVEALHREWVGKMVDLQDFPYCYFVNGATDAIHHWVMTEKRPWQYMEGEYEYPGIIGTPGKSICDVPGQHMNEETHRVALPSVAELDKPLYVSIPSAADGNIFYPNIDKWKITPPVILDCTYVSATQLQKIEVPSTTEQIFFSFSKGFGLISHRLGLVYTKEPHLTLHRLKEFENWNYSGVETMKLIMTHFAVDEMWNIYKDKQLKICKEYDFTPSSVFYLATTKDRFYMRRRRMRWNDDARICLTPLFEDYL
jgi:hypothetical protein